MADFDARFWQKIDNLLADALDRLDAVVEKINLTLALNLAINGVANDALIVAANDCFNGQPIERRRFDR